MSEPPPTLRPANSDDASGITRVVQASFPPSLLGAMIYGADGAETWVRAHLAVPPALAERVFTVAVQGSAVLAAADVQRAAGTLFLAYIAVRPAARGGGLATRLLAAALDGAAASGYNAFALDVFADNAGPRRWYARLGLDEVGESVWWAADTAAGAAPESSQGLVLDWPVAEAAQRAFGFSQFRVVTAVGTHGVGRIGRGWYRITAPAALEDTHLRATLHRLDPARRLLVIGPRSALPAGTQPLATSVRMRGPLVAVRAHLAARAAPGSMPASAILTV